MTPKHLSRAEPTGQPAKVNRRASKKRVRPRSSGRSSLPLAASLINRTGLIEPERVANSLGLSKRQLAETVGLKQETFYKASRIRAQKTQSRVKEMLEIVGRVSEWAGGKAQALAWYRAQPIPAFDGRTAEAIVKSGKAAALRDYLDQFAMGGFA
jgi:hypothetical protein